jgi:hypothetical protein
VLDAAPFQGIDQALGAGDVVGEVAARPLHGLADGLVRGEVDAGVDVVVDDELHHQVLVRDVADDERGVEHGLLATALQRVEHDDVAAELAEPADGVGADVAGTAGDEDGHPGEHRSGPCVATLGRRGPRRRHPRAGGGDRVRHRGGHGG